MKKRLISLLLAFSMVISLLPVGAFAETPTTAPAVQECQGLTFSGGKPNSQNTDKTKGWTYDGTTLTILDGFRLSGDSTLRVTCNVVNQGTIAGGIFTGEVTLPAGHDAVISGGVFGSLDYMEYNTKPGTFRAKITGGVFTNTTARQIIDSGSKTYTISTKTSFVINTTNQTAFNKITVVTDASNRCGYAISLGTMEIKNINGQDTQAYCTEHSLTYQLEDATYREYSLTIPADHVYSEDITLNEDVVLSIVDGYPKQSNGGQKDVTIGDGWDFVASTDTAHPENGVLTLYQTEVELDPATPVKCKTVIQNSTTSMYMTNIKSGTFDGPVELQTGLVTDGTFNNTVTLTSRNNCYINGGTYNGAVTVKAGSLNGGLYKSTVELTSAYSEIHNGAFAQTVTNNGGKILGGAFAGSVVGKYYAGIFAQEPDHSQFASADYHVWTLTTGSETYVFNSLLTLSSGTPLYVVGGRKPGSSSEIYYPYGYYSLTSGTLKYVNQKEYYQIGNYEACYFDVDNAGQIVRFNNYDPSSYRTYKYKFEITDDATVSLDSRIIPLEIEADGYPVGTAGGTTAKSGDGWSFTPSTTGIPADGTLTLTGSNMELGSTPVKCKVALKGASSSSYASIASGTFQNTVTLEQYATLKNGTYNGAVSFKSPTTSITNGTFNAEVKTDYRQFDNETPKISGGAFNDAVDFPQGVYISGGTFEAPVTTDNGFSCISGGIFKNTVTVSKGYVSGGIFAGTVTLKESDGRYGGLYQELPNETLDDGSEATTLIWTLTTSGDDSYTFNDILTLSADSRLYLAAPSASYNYEFYITDSDLKYANQTKISDNTTITADGTPCGSIAAYTNRHEFALTRSATVLLQSALDPLVIDETGYPVGTNGGTKAYTGEGWSYARYAAYGPDAAKGLLTLSSGTFDAINSDQPALCDVKVNADVTLSSGSFAGTVTCYGILDGGTFSRKVNVEFPNGTVLRDYPTIKSGTFTETSEVTVDSIYTYIKSGTFNGTVTNKGNIKGGMFYGTVTNKYHIKGGEFYGTVTNDAHAAGEYSAVIETGEFHGHVINGDSIQDGTFTGEVTNSGTIRNGTFGGTVTNNNTVNGGTFNGEVLNGAIGTLKGGTFTGSVTNNGRIVGSDSTYTGPVTNRGTIESGTFEGSVKNYGTLMGGTFSGEVQNNADPEDTTHSGIICFSTEDGVYAPPLFTETSTVTNTGIAKIQDGTFLGTVKGVVEGGVYVQKPTSEKPISRMTYRYQDSEGNGKTGALTINYEIKDAAYVVNSDTTHVFVTLTNLASPLENINGETFSETACGLRTWALHRKLPKNAEPIILNKATSLAAGDLIVNLPGGESRKVPYDGQRHEATIELVSDALDYLLDDPYGYETVKTEDGGRTLKIYYKYFDGSGIKDTAPTEIGTYEVLYRGHSTYYGNGRVFEITENIHKVTVTDGFIVKVEHPGAVGTDDTTGDDTTEDPISTATVRYGDTVTVTIDASKFPSGMVFDRWETTPVDLPLAPTDGESYKTVTFTMPAEDVTLRAVPCTVEEKAASGGSSPLGTAALVVVGGAAAGVLVWQGYELGTELYLHSVLPSGVAIPETRGQLAVVLWQAAGSPAPAAPLAPDAADTQKAMAWVVEHALLEDKTGNFDPREPVNKTEVIRAWNQLNKQGLAQQAK